MAISSTFVWECRTAATAANANGGGYKPGSTGTDYSQQNAAQYNLTSLTSSAANAIILSASASADMVGNIIHVISGTNATPGWYEILSVSVGVSITVDRNWGTGIVAAGVANIGGAMSLGSITANQTDANFWLVPIAGNTVWIKAGTYNVGSSMVGSAGTLLAPISFRGYNSARGDNPTGTNRPVFSSTSTNTPAAYNFTYNMIMTSNGTATLTPGSHAYFENCKIVQTSTTTLRNAITAGQHGVLKNCEIISYRGTAYSMGSNSATFFGCYIHDSSQGILLTSGNLYCHQCIFADITNSSIISSSTTVVATIFNCTFYGVENKAGNAITNFDTNNLLVLFNNIFYGLQTAVQLTGAYLGDICDYNNYFNNTTDVSNLVKGPHDIALNPSFTGMAQIVGAAGTVSGTTLTDAGANFSTVTDNVDFVFWGNDLTKYLITAHTTTTLTLDATSGSPGTASYQITTGHNFAIGTNLKAKGFPGAFQGATTTGFMDIGAVQRQEPAGGGSGMLFTQGMDGL